MVIQLAALSVAYDKKQNSFILRVCYSSGAFVDVNEVLSLGLGVFV